MRSNIIEVDEAGFDERVVEASRERPVVVDFWAAWCRPCRVLGPILERLADEHAGDLVLAKVDVDANQMLASRYGVQGIPAVKAFRQGEVVAEFVGAQPEDGVRRWLRDVLPSPAEGLVAEGGVLEGRGDLDAAEAIYRRAVEADPASEAAVVALARVLLERGEAEEAERLAARQPQSAEARGLAARARLATAAPRDDLDDLRARAADDPTDEEAVLAVAAQDAARGDHGDALERCLRLIRARGESRDRARELMVSIFEALGEDHPLVREYRPRLAAALY